MSVEHNFEECAEIVSRLQKVYYTGRSKSIDFRVRNLLGLKRFLQDNELDIKDALRKDLHRSSFEAVGLEIVPCIMEIDHIVSNLKSWMKPVRTGIPALMAPAVSEYIYEPFGVVLVISAFNYPISLTFGPLIGAICAGNVAVIKPSELSVATEQLLRERLPRYIDHDCFEVVCGGIPTTQALLAQHWDKIFFTGSTRVGKIVMQAAAQKLTPVSLELGGKSPTIIDESVTDLELATRRIIWGKCANAGQTCIAPDYVLCHEKYYDEFLDTAARIIKEFFGPNPHESPDLCRIVSVMHCERLKALLDDNPGRFVVGGKIILEERYVEPTIIADVKMTSKIMQEEIFGPILPVIKVSSTDEMIRTIHTLEKPLSMYIFSKDNEMIDRMITEVSSGGVLVNDTLFHFGNNFVPFGGVGPSGTGGYHGRFSFECFSHRRTVMRRDDHRIFDIPIRYPPYTDFGLKFFKFASRLPSLPSITAKDILLLSVKVCVAGFVAYCVVNTIMNIKK